ncbi:MAG: hypothetical protein AAF918_16300 [Pseudomonadota bacterium]
MSAAIVKSMSLDEVSELRGVSQSISRHLRTRLERYLNTLPALFAPRKILGEYLQSASDGRVAGAEAHYKHIAQQFESIAKSALGVKSKLGSPLPAINGNLVLSPWQYRHTLAGTEDLVIVSSPVQWILHYQSDYAALDFMQDILRQDVSQDGAKQFLINALTIARLLESSEVLQQLLADLRFPVTIQETEWIPGLPLVLIGCELPLVRPEDDVIAKVTSLSGQPNFEELVDVEQLPSLADPFMEELKSASG